MQTFLKCLILSIVLAPKIHLYYRLGEAPELENRSSPRYFIKLKVNFRVRESRTQHLYGNYLRLQAALEHCRFDPCNTEAELWQRSGNQTNICFITKRDIGPCSSISWSLPNQASVLAGGFCFPKSEMFSEK